MTRHYQDLGSASDWSRPVGNLIQPIRSTTQISIVTRHHYGIFAFVFQTSFGGETSGYVAKCRLFSQAKMQCNQLTLRTISLKSYRYCRYHGLLSAIWIRHNLLFRTKTLTKTATLSRLYLSATFS